MICLVGFCGLPTSNSHPQDVILRGNKQSEGMTIAFLCSGVASRRSGEFGALEMVSDMEWLFRVERDFPLGFIDPKVRREFVVQITPF